MKTYEALAKRIGALGRCVEWSNKGQGDYKEAIADHNNAIDEIMAQFPTGSGFDNGHNLSLVQSTGERIVISTSYHHMNEGGYYEGWTEHDVVITPSLEMGYRVKVTGKDRNDIKAYIAEQFSYVLDSETSVV